MDDLLDSVSKLKSILMESRNVLITAHKSPDPDAIGSMLALAEIFQNYFKNISYYLCIEQGKLDTAKFLKHYSKIIYGEGCIKHTILQKNIDTVILLDANDFYRALVNSTDVDELTHKNGEYTKDLRKIIIDHHIEKPVNIPDLWINMHLSSTAETLYKLFIKGMQLGLTKSLAEAFMFGILGDTGRFLYPNSYFRDTVNVAADLVEAGVDIQQIDKQFSSVDIYGIKVLEHMLSNVKIINNFVYSFISDEFMRILKEDYHVDEFKYPDYYHKFISTYLQNIEGTDWGFVVVPVYQEKGLYHISFRSSKDIDVHVLATRLGGGGHLRASAAKIRAKNIESAIRKVLSVINSVYKEEASDD